MSPDWIPIVAFCVFFVPPIVAIIAAYALERAERRKRPPADETGDPINPQALKDWRKANREAFK
jgi:hypothetical protein